jgi:hypothetical protein
MSGTERPQYGEYASEEEQAKAIARSGAAPAPRKPADPVRPASASARSASARSASPRIADRMATIFLLAFGLVYLIGGVGSYLDLPTAMRAVYEQFGIDGYTPLPQTAAIGVAIVASQAVIWLVTAVWAYRRLAAARVAWWIPVLGAVVSFLVSVILLGSLLVADPDLLAHLTRA